MLGSRNGPHHGSHVETALRCERKEMPVQEGDGERWKPPLCCQTRYKGPNPPSRQELCIGSPRHSDARLDLPLLALAWSVAGPECWRIHPLVLFPQPFQLDAAGSASRLHSYAALCCSRRGRAELSAFLPFPFLSRWETELLGHKKPSAREFVTSLGQEEPCVRPSVGLLYKVV